MGLFDFFRKKPATEASSPPPSVPCEATIESFVVADGVGGLALEGGGSLNFGRSACVGFEPMVGLRVSVKRVMLQRDVWRAAELGLAVSNDAYDALLAARDAQLGVLPPKPAEVAALAMTMGWVIVLLDDAPASGRAGFLAWAEKHALVTRGLTPKFEAGQASFRIGTTEVLAYLSHEPLAEDQFVALGLTADFDAGDGFIALSLGLPSAEARLRAVGGSDVWEAQGRLRALSRAAKVLSELGHAVVLPQAGAVVESDRFRNRLGDLDNLDARPFGAWIAWSVDAEARAYSTYGMQSLGFPDVEVSVDPDDPWSLDRACEALLLTCSKMVHSDKDLADGDVLEVPVGIGVGALPPKPSVGDVELYVVRDGAKLRLESASPAGGPRAQWGRRPSEVALNTYSELYSLAFGASMEAEYETSLSMEEVTDVPEFTVDVWEATNAEGYFMSTKGLGRVQQPGGVRDMGTAHVELVAAMARHHPLIASVIGAVGVELHRHGPDAPFKVGDTVGLAVPELAAAGFVLADAGALEIAEGPAVHLLELIPVTASEYNDARTMGSHAFLSEQRAMTPAARAARWQLRLN